MNILCWLVVRSFVFFLFSFCYYVESRVAMFFAPRQNLTPSSSLLAIFGLIPFGVFLHDERGSPIITYRQSTVVNMFSKRVNKLWKYEDYLPSFVIVAWIVRRPHRHSCCCRKMKEKSGEYDAVLVSLHIVLIVM